MTEEEAKTKWCPMRRITRMGNVQIDNTDGKEFTLNCIGSACMMWRKSGYTIPGCDTVDGYKPAVFAETGGHCGLASGS